MSHSKASLAKGYMYEASSYSDAEATNQTGVPVGAGLCACPSWCRKSLPRICLDVKARVRQRTSIPKIFVVSNVGRIEERGGHGGAAPTVCFGLPCQLMSLVSEFPTLLINRIS